MKLKRSYTLLRLPFERNDIDIKPYTYRSTMTNYLARLIVLSGNTAVATSLPPMLST